MAGALSGWRKPSRWGWHSWGRSSGWHGCAAGQRGPAVNAGKRHEVGEAQVGGGVASTWPGRERREEARCRGSLRRLRCRLQRGPAVNAGKRVDLLAARELACWLQRGPAVNAGKRSGRGLGAPRAWLLQRGPAVNAGKRPARPAGQGAGGVASTWPGRERREEGRGARLLQAGPLRFNVARP